ncbi:MAG: transposase [Candidatus Endonucleobacter sp. (ex Gigantidas childressi)]|nr:transposase [Candidatus Endonucleobacter sp. (ex Gigantidas childressi)]
MYASNTGRPSYPLLTLFRALLLGTWCRLSDVQLAQCLYIPVAFQVATLLAALAHPRSPTTRRLTGLRLLAA